MFSTIKKYIIGALLLVLLTQSTVQAQSLGQKGSNIANFLGLQFDVSDILEDYKANLLLNDNTCKQTDRFAILDAQDQIVNNLLQNYDTITSERQVELINQYQLLEIELEFLKEIDILIENEDFSAASNLLISELKKNLPSEFHPDIDTNFQSIASKYEDRYRIYDAKTDSFKEGTYLNCPTSWSSITKRVDSISSEVTKIQQEWEDIKEALDKLKNTSKKTFSPSNIKRLAIKTKDTVVDGAETSLENLKREWNESRKEAYKLAVKPIETYQDTLQQNQSLISNRSDIRALLLSDKPITQITEQFNRQADLQSLIGDAVIKNTTLQITLQHSDAGYYSIVNNAYQTPNILQENAQIFQTEDQNGIIAKSKQVYSQQCSI